MTYKIRSYKRAGVVRGLEVDIAVVMPDGRTLRERRKAPVGSKSGAERWAQARERELFTAALVPKKAPDAPKLSEFWERFLRDHARANGHKPSGIESKAYGYRQFLRPHLGHLGLDEITTAEIAKLKSAMVQAGKSPATVNNTLALISKVLKVAVEWGVLSAVPCRISRLKKQDPKPGFYEFEEYERLVRAAGVLGPNEHLMVLLGGDAGLRRGEIIALDQAKCDTRRKLLIIDRSEWAGHVTETKGMEARVVEMTDRLCAAIKAHRHLRSTRLLFGERGGAVNARSLRSWMAKVQAGAGVPKTTGELHVLRHTFCSHLAMRGVPALTIQKLAGHQSLQTTLRYMHLTEGETARAIQCLRGEMLETIEKPAKNLVD